MIRSYGSLYDMRSESVSDHLFTWTCPSVVSLVVAFSPWLRVTALKSRQKE